jgi:hypothetical protein
MVYEIETKQTEFSLSGLYRFIYLFVLVVLLLADRNKLFVTLKISKFYQPLDMNRSKTRLLTLCVERVVSCCCYLELFTTFTLANALLSVVNWAMSLNLNLLP